MPFYLAKDLSGEKLFFVQPYVKDNHYVCDDETQFVYLKDKTIYKIVKDYTYGLWEFNIESLNIFKKVYASFLLITSIHKWCWKYPRQFNEYSKEQNKRRNNLNAKWQAFLNADYSDWDYPSRLMITRNLNRITDKIENLGHTKFENNEVEFLISQFAESVKE